MAGSIQDTSGGIDAVATLSITPVAGRIGAEVQGVALADLPRDGERARAILPALHDALGRHKVLFFRGQSAFDDAAHQTFARLWGMPVNHPTAPAQSGESLLELDSRHGGKANIWHTDMTFLASYPSASILRAVLIPPAGGDTMWANTVEAYARLPPPLRVLADTLWGIHSNDYDYAANQTEPDAGVDAYHAAFVSSVYEAEQPLVRVHPVTGERALVLGGFFSRFSGLGSTESRHLFDIFQAHVTRAENTVRWRWREGDVAVWDNRATQHYAIDDYGNQPRIVRRVTIAGDVPVSVDGRCARQILPMATPDLRVAGDRFAQCVAGIGAGLPIPTSGPAPQSGPS
ncbi:TauD/TfdA family dioxygenase [Komagataeibacter sp. FNDCF1]|uniref:TauD/TfdA dioxygenase family protein n=1 Tax=Komagataeibacter sp. FNDCF1 TaxID=2878681 RepID=UPI001E4E79B6|nr:TauD/TfdA family dioxygenase [Komagataeibacter sp. FNDCF1]MCE2563600.1 TauD/TfdA family dioxygenase [Komagataeibacter sp. FNDCF1]